jgi:hypothetical protein
MTNAQSKFQVYVPNAKERCIEMFGIRAAACLKRVEYGAGVERHRRWGSTVTVTNGDMYNISLNMRECQNAIW